MGRNSPTERAWAAGIVDADGCITIKRRKIKGGVYYALFVIVAQSGVEAPTVITRLHEMFLGNVEEAYVQPNGPPNRLPRWSWQVTTMQAEVMLLSIRPFLVGKADQADVALEYRREALGRGKGTLAESYYWKLRGMKNYTFA